MLADSSNGFGSHTLEGGIFLSSSLCLMAMCWWLFLPAVYFSLDMRIQIVMRTQPLHVHLFRPLYQICCICRSLPLLRSASHNYWFWLPRLENRLQNLPSQDRYSLRKATVGRIHSPHDFPVQNLVVFHVGFCVPDVRSSFVSVTSSFTFWSVSAKEVYPSTVCIASLNSLSWIYLRLFLLCLSCVLHTLCIFTKPRPLSFQGVYNSIIYELGCTQRILLVVFLQAYKGPRGLCQPNLLFQMLVQLVRLYGVSPLV